MNRIIEEIVIVHVQPAVSMKGVPTPVQPPVTLPKQKYQEKRHENAAEGSMVHPIPQPRQASPVYETVLRPSGSSIRS